MSIFHCVDDACVTVLKRGADGSIEESHWRDLNFFQYLHHKLFMCHETVIG